jgi:hypothetical protein
MVREMRRLALFLALTALSGPAFADPLTDALKKAGGTLCFTRAYDSAWLKSHRGQTVRDVRFALTSDATLRMSLQGAGRPIYIYGACNWYQGDLNRGVQDNILDPTFKPTTGVGCHAMTDTTGVSAEEGGDFPVAWGNGNYVQVHLDGGVAGWRSTDSSKPVSWPKLGRADSIFRLNRAPASACRALITKFAPD